MDILGQKCIRMVQEENAQREREREMRIVWGVFTEKSQITNSLYNSYIIIILYSEYCTYFVGNTHYFQTLASYSAQKHSVLESLVILSIQCGGQIISLQGRASNSVWNSLLFMA